MWGAAPHPAPLLKKGDENFCSIGVPGLYVILRRTNALAVVRQRKGYVAGGLKIPRTSEQMLFLRYRSCDEIPPPFCLLQKFLGVVGGFFKKPPTRSFRKIQ